LGVEAPDEAPSARFILPDPVKCRENHNFGVLFRNLTRWPYLILFTECTRKAARAMPPGLE